DTLSIGGSVSDDGNGCGDCTIQSAFLHQFSDGNGTKEVGTPIRVDLTVNNAFPSPPCGSPAPAAACSGTIAGTYSGNYVARAKYVQLWVVAKDAAGNLSQPG